MEDEQTSAADENQPDDSGASVKTVPESDLISLKQSLKTKAQESKVALEEAAKQLTQATDSLGQERAAKEAAEAKVQELEPTVTELATLKAEHATTETALNTLKEAQLNLRREALVTRGIDSEKVKTLDEAAIVVLEANLPAQTKKVPGNGFDINGSGSGDLTGLSGRALIKAGVSGSQ
jgi:vacuolar-type H+-ATPase subunit I/STV1